MTNETAMAALQASDLAPVFENNNGMPPLPLTLDLRRARDYVLPKLF